MSERGGPRILIAASAMKGTLPARETARALALGVGEGTRRAFLERLLVADGGDGTAEVLAACLRGSRRREARVRGPLGELHGAVWYAAPQSVAILDLASACGARLVAPSPGSPMGASTCGLGDLIRAALDSGASTLLVGLGGSASVDGGMGAAAALGIRFLDRRGVPLDVGGGALSHLDHVDRSGLDPRIARTRILLLCDVTSPLVGPCGAARRYGPQKGAGPKEVCILENGLRRLARVLAGPEAPVLERLPGGGAAGGTAAGLARLLGARVFAGASTILDLERFDLALGRADAVLCCEGRYDGARHPGKITEEVLRRASRAGVPAAVICAGKGRGAAAPPGTRVISSGGARLDAAGLRRLARLATRDLVGAA